jgi:hypothetical protein
MVNFTTDNHQIEGWVSFEVSLDKFLLYQELNPSNVAYNQSPYPVHLTEDENRSTF